MAVFWCHVIRRVGVAVFGYDMLLHSSMWFVCIGGHCPVAVGYWTVDGIPCLTHLALWPIFHVGRHGWCGGQRRGDRQSVPETVRIAMRLAHRYHSKMILFVPGTL